jgi:hypothetical protein
MLFFDPRDRSGALGCERLRWLRRLGARPVSEARAGDTGYLFAGDRGGDDYRRLLAGRDGLSDRPEVRAQMQDLGRVLERVGGAVPTPRTWRLELDAPLPEDLAFPLFVRTARTSWKLGGAAGRARNVRDLEAECAELRRAFGWDAVVLAREWVELAPAGEWRRGPVPQEVRVWIVDGRPFAWSFHHLHVIPEPRGFPPRGKDLEELRRHGAAVGARCPGRLVVADFAKARSGGWWLIEADSGSAAGTAHEGVFAAVARRLEGEPTRFMDSVGGTFDD